MAIGKKESQFTVKTIINDSDFVRMFVPGTNLAISFSDFKSSLGVTGTINQVGNPLAVPVLEKIGNANNIRNLQSGAGMQFSVAADNGIIAKWNISQDSTGVPITSGLSDLIPVMSSLVPGAGMQISKIGDVITLTATGAALPATKAVAVNQLSDFPSPSGGVITLEADTVYIISNNVTTADRFVRQNNTSIVGYSQLGPSLTYTGTGTMFTSVDSSTLIFGLRLNCPNGKIFDWSDTTGNTKVETIKETRIDSCVDFGDFTGGLGLVVFSGGAANVTGRGIKMFGTGWSLISIERFSQVTANAAFVGVDLGSAISGSIELANLIFVGPSGAVGITGLPSSGNITAGNLGTILAANFLGAITPITSIDPVTDIRWESRANDGIGNSRDDSLISIQSNASETIIASSSTPVKMVGTWTDEGSSRFTVTTVGGRITFIGERPARLPISATISMLTAAGGDKQVSGYIAINGSVVTATKITDTASNNKAGTVNLIWQHEFQTNDYVEIFLANEDNTENLIGQSAVVRID